MRQLGSLLILFGVLGLATGALGALAPAVNPLSRAWSYGTWPGIGPFLAGILLILIGLLLRSADRTDLDV